MSISASVIQRDRPTTTTVGGGEVEVEAIAGRSPTQLAMARFRKDRLSMVSFTIVALFILVAIAAPFLVKLGVLDPYAFNSTDKILDVNSGGIPRGALSGISGD